MVNVWVDMTDGFQIKKKLAAYSYIEVKCMTTEILWKNELYYCEVFTFYVICYIIWKETMVT
jgi:hypothetical protein